MRRLLPPLALLLAAGCAGTETGNPGQKPTTTTAQVGLTAFSSDATVVALPAAMEPPPGEIAILEAWVSVHELELRACSDASGNRYRIQDLVGDVAAGSLLSQLKVPVTDYCRVEVQIEKPEDSAPENPLGDDTLQITGLRADGTPFTVASRRGFELELRSRGTGFGIDATRSALLVAFDALRWFDGVDLDGAEVDDHSIRIDDQHNAALLAAFEANVSRSLGVYRDDGDGELEDGEDHAVAGGEPGDD
jgi:hypothetical protein